MATRERLESMAKQHGLLLVGVTNAAPLPDDRARMEESVAAGRMGDMDWMGGERPAIATDVQQHQTGCAVGDRGRGAIWRHRPAHVGRGADALHRALAPVLAAEPREPAGRIARYAVGSDYHVALRRRLEGLATDLREAGLPAGSTAYVDDRPLAERALAARAGLGWIGKNTNLLTHDRAGSWVFLGAVLSSAELPVDEPVRTNCGSCTRCLSGCPTGALVAPQTIDARRCISYLTIEHRGVLGEWESQAIGDWIFGCDVCQEVCPVNADAPDDGPLRVPLLPLIEWLLPLGTRAYERAVGETALTRAGRHRLLRNAIAALGNVDPMPDGAHELLQRASQDRRAEVRQQAAQVLAET